MDIKIGAQDVINALFNPDEVVNFRIIDDKKSGVFQGLNLSEKASNYALIEPKLIEHNKLNRAISFVVNSGGKSDKDITKINAVFTEMDDAPFDEQQKRIDAFPLKPSMVIRTRKSYHVYWFTKDVPVSSFRPIQKALIEAFHGDPNCVNESRCLRLPGFMHCKLDPIEVTCIAFNPELKYTEEQLKAALPNIKYENATPIEKMAGDETGLEIVIAECEFIKHCRDNAKTLPEHDWYAMITNLAPFIGGTDLIHRLSKPYDGYSFDKTQEKINHFLESGTRPITCKIIAEKGYKCPKMLSGECECKSPAALCYKPLTPSGLETLLSYIKPQPDLLKNLQLATDFIKKYLFNQDDSIAEVFIRENIKKHFKANKPDTLPNGAQIDSVVEFKSDTIKSLITTYKTEHKIYKQGLDLKKTKLEATDMPEWYRPNGKTLKFMPKILANYLRDNIHAFYAAQQRFVYVSGVYVVTDEMETKKIVQEKLIDSESVMQQINDAEAQWMLQIQKSAKEINPNPYIINLRNGLYNLIDNTFTPHDPAFLSTIQLNVNYNTEADCPLFKKYLNEVMDGNESQIKLIQEILGYVLIPTNKAQKCFVIEGVAQAGKSLLLRVISEILLGKENVSSIAWQSLNERFLKAELYGKLANVFSDLPTKNIEDNGIFKALVGEDLITVEKKNKNPFSFTSFARLIFSCNEIPKNYGDKSEGFYRRLIIIKFMHQIPKEKKDPNLFDKFVNEADGIFIYALEGLRRIIKNNYIFTTTDENDEFLERYKEESDSIMSFVNSTCELNGDFETKPRELYNSYETYCDETNLKPYAFISFCKKLLVQYPNIQSIRVNGKEGRKLKGIKFVGVDF